MVDRANQAGQLFQEIDNIQNISHTLETTLTTLTGMNLLPRRDNISVRCRKEGCPGFGYYMNWKNEDDR
jgi:hypothetical protein